MKFTTGRESGCSSSSGRRSSRVRCVSRSLSDATLTSWYAGGGVSMGAASFRVVSLEEIEGEEN